jgi:hypothetical protein
VSKYVWQQEVRDAAIHARAKASAADVAAWRSDPARRHHQPRDADATPGIRVVVERIRLHVRPPESLSGSRAHATHCRIESRTGNVFKREGLMGSRSEQLSDLRSGRRVQLDRARIDELIAEGLRAQLQTGPLRGVRAVSARVTLTRVLAAARVREGRLGAG